MNIQEFLDANLLDEETTLDIPLSSRMKDKEGNLLKFKIKPVPSDEYADIQNKYIKYDMKKKELKTDTLGMHKELVINYTVEPNFRNEKSIKAANCKTPKQYLDKVLKSGEIVKLATEIQKFSGYDDEDVDVLREEAKN